MSKNIILNANTVQSVYSGKRNKCCCGCAGKHYYRPGIDGIAVRGYEIPDTDYSPRMINKVTKLVQDAINRDDPSLDVGDSHVAFDQGERTYIVYPQKGVVL